MIKFLNAKINGEDASIPQYLYKYRPFDGFTYDMLDNNYLYLCPAEILDDPSECKATFSIQDFYDIKTNQLKFRCVDKILDFIRPYTTESNFQLVKSFVSRTLTPNGLVRRDYLLENAFDIQALVPKVDIAPLINFLGNIPEKLNDPKIQSSFERLISLAHYARQEMGICSLSESNGSTDMWDNYANGSTGYCVEYDMRDYINSEAVFPVIYQDDRETDVATNILSSFISGMIFGMSNGQIKADKSQYIRMFLTKDMRWQYQKEWRLIGDAGQKVSAPSVNAVYLGKNISELDKRQIELYCKTRNIAIR